MKEKEVLYIFMILMIILVGFTGLVLVTSLIPEETIVSVQQQETFYVWDDRCEEVKQIPVVVEINLPTPTLL